MTLRSESKVIEETLAALVAVKEQYTSGLCTHEEALDKSITLVEQGSNQLLSVSTDYLGYATKLAQMQRLQRKMQLVTQLENAEVLHYLTVRLIPVDLPAMAMISADLGIEA